MVSYQLPDHLFGNRGTSWHSNRLWDDQTLMTVWEWLRLSTSVFVRFSTHTVPRYSAINYQPIYMVIRAPAGIPKRPWWQWDSGWFEISIAIMDLSHMPHCFEGVRIMFMNRPWAIQDLVMNIHNPFMHGATSQYVFKPCDVMMLMHAVTIVAA